MQQSTSRHLGDVDLGCGGAIATALQKRIEESIGSTPLRLQEVRSIVGMPNHFMTLLGGHNQRDHSLSTTYRGQVIFIHVVPDENTPPETIRLSCPPKTGIPVRKATQA